MHTRPRATTLSALLIIATLFLTLLTAACSNSSGASLSTHIDKIASIAESNKDKPADAVDELHKYLQDNLPSILKEVAAVAVSYDKASSDDDRKKVIEDLTKSLKEPLEKAEKSVGPLFVKIQGDKDALKKLEDIQKKFAMIGAVLSSVGK
jgi:hypothetical protein